MTLPLPTLTYTEREGSRPLRPHRGPHAERGHRRRIAPPVPGAPAWKPDWAPALALCLVGVGLALAAHQVVPQVGTLTWAVLAGMAAANLGMVPTAVEPGLGAVTRRLLRAGVVLLGLSLSVMSILALGAPVILLVAVTLLTTLGVTYWFGRRLHIGHPRSLLIATGFAICGASAIAAMEETAEADEEDVATAIAMVTICGTVAMLAVPLLQHPLGLTDTQLGAWAGASVHEVGQVVAAAGPAGSAAVAVAVVVKLTRVLLLAPVVAGVGLVSRHRARRTAETTGHRKGAPPLLPLFVAGFLACVAVRSTGWLPEEALTVAGYAQTVALGAALFGMGTAVRFATLVRRSGPALVLSTGSTLVIAGVSLAGVVALV